MRDVPTKVISSPLTVNGADTVPMTDPRRNVSRKVPSRRPFASVPISWIRPLPNGVPLTVPRSSSVPGAGMPTVRSFPFRFTAWRARLPRRVVVASW